jgi:hypothetical protein
VRQTALPDSVAEHAGQRRDAAPSGRGAAACSELVVDEPGDVQVVELFRPDRADGGDEVLPLTMFA